MKLEEKFKDISLEEAFSKKDAPNLDSLEMDTYVEDIEPLYLVKGGYGVWELSIIHKIMIKLWNDFDNPKYTRKAVSKDYPMWSLSLFNEAVKIYENTK